jgi:hypothetical protein
MSKFTAIKRVSGTLIFDGSEDWVLLSQSELYARIRIVGFLIDKNALQSQENTAIIVFGDGFKLTSLSNYPTDTETLNLGGATLNDALGVTILKSRLDVYSGANVLEKFKDYLDTVGAQLLYQLKTPIQISESAFPDYGIEVDGQISSNNGYTEFVAYDYNILPSAIDVIYSTNLAQAVQNLKDNTINLNEFRQAQATLNNITEVIDITANTEIGVGWNQGEDEVYRLSASRNFNRLDFDTLAPWVNIKRCLLNDDGTVNYYLHPTNSALKADGVTASVLDGTDGQVMVEIPKFYYRSVGIKTAGQSKYEWYISDTPRKGYQVHPAFVRDGVEKDKIYFGAFEGCYNPVTEKMESRADVVPSTNNGVSDEGLSPINAYDAIAGTSAGDIRNTRLHAQARGAGWEQQDFLTRSALQLLYLIEYADFDSQSTIGLGVTSKASGTNNNANKTGATVFLGNASGRESGTNNLCSVSYRGVENMWGNIWEWLDGINLQDYVAYVSAHSFESDKFTTPYESVGTVLSINSTFIKDILYNGLDYGFLATEGGGSSASYLHDNWFTSSGNRVVRSGGFWFGSSGAGAFSWNSNDGAAGASRSRGARLSFLG